MFANATSGRIPIHSTLSMALLLRYILPVYLIFCLYIARSAQSRGLVIRSLSNNSSESQQCISNCRPPNGLMSKMFSYNSTSDADAPPLQQGWTPQPGGRGTIDIIWSSVATIILCCWTVPCLNVPSRYWGPGERLLRKTVMACLVCLAPEFVFQLALGQWASARRSVDEFKHSGYPQWSMTHAFFADMGGFVLHPRDWVPFPLNAKQVHYLVTKNYIPYGAVAIDKDVINDKNKSDSLARSIAIGQVLWFSITCLGRAIYHLPITTLELTTVDFILITLGTAFLWYHKPQDVMRPMILVPDAILEDILIRAGDSAQVSSCKRTPLDFVNERNLSFIRYWTYGMNILAKLGIVFDLTARDWPATKIPDDNFPFLSKWERVVAFLGQITFAAIPICAWNFQFPTATERLLWRISSLYIICAVILYWVIDIYAWHAHSAVKRFVNRFLSFKKTETHDNTAPLQTTGFSSKVQKFAARLRNISPDHDPELDVPLKAIIPIGLLGAIYCFARYFTFLEDVISLRSQPPAAFKTVNWSDFLPHI